MYDVHYWPTPNGHKITLFMEECGLPYRLVPVNINTGAQFAPDFLRLSPNNRIPALVDPLPADGGEPITVFESGAILTYLAEKHGRFLPATVRGRKEVLEWLFWQVGGLGPMLGQNHHFVQYAPERVPYAIDRYVRETNRLYGVLDRRLEGREFLCGELSIADFAAYPWCLGWQKQLQDLANFPQVSRWLEAIAARPATQRAYARAAEFKSAAVTEEAKKVLFGQAAAAVVAPPGA